ANGSSERRIALGPAWRSVRLGWRPRGDAEHARAFLWLPAGGVFEVRRLAVGRAGGGGPLVSASTALQGSLPEAQLQSRFQAAESRFVESRFTGLRLAADAFRQKPLTGIGWEAFPAYAAAHASFGLLASHDEYARIAAELGFPGLVLIAAIVLTLVLAIRRVPASPTRLAAAGLLAAAGVNLAFVNALVTPTTSLPIALALGWICFPRAVAPAAKR